MAIQKFTGGKQSVQSKLNQLVDAVNGLLSIRGGQFVRVVRNASGISIDLMIDQIVSRVPKIGSSGGSIIPVLVRKVGGVAGGPASQCTFTYNAWRITDDPEDSSIDPIIEAQQPQRRRMAAGTYSEARNDTLGIAFWDARDSSDGPHWVLLDAFDEVPSVFVCDCLVGA